MTGAPEGGLGGLLLRHRLRLGLSQDQLARRSGLGVRTIRNLERGMALRPRRDSVRLLVDALHLEGEARDLFERAAAPRPTPAAEADAGGPAHPGPAAPVPRRRRRRVAVVTGMLTAAVLVATAAVAALTVGHVQRDRGAAAPGCAGAAPPTGRPGVPAGCRGVWWGLYEGNVADLGLREACLSSRGSVCRRFDVFSRYYSLGQLASAPTRAARWPSADDARLARGGRVLFLTISIRCEAVCPGSFDGQPLPPPMSFALPPSEVVRPWFRPQDIADGRLDGLLHAAAATLKDFPGRSW